MCGVTQRARGLLGVMPTACRDRLSPAPTSSSTSGMLHRVGRLYRPPSAPGTLLAALDLARRAEARSQRLLGRHDEEGRAVTALIHSPRVLVLDEPLRAIDPVSMTNIARSSPTTRAEALSSSCPRVVTTVQRLCTRLPSSTRARPRRRNRRRGRPGRPGGHHLPDGGVHSEEGLSWLGQLIRLSSRIIWNTVRRQTAVRIARDPRHPAVRDHVCGRWWEP